MNISENLKNDHNVYILGAGFSYEAGLPLISDFLIRMRDSHEWLVDQKRIKEADAIAKVLAFRLEAASAAYWVKLDLENIEELFSLASTSAGEISGQIRLAIAATLDYARKIKGSLAGTLSVSDGKGIFKPEAANKPGWLKLKTEDIANKYRCYSFDAYQLITAHLLGILKTGSPKGENTFITFNYDTLLEDALIQLNLPVTYGTEIGMHPASSGDNAKPHIPVYKMHGSMNWARTQNQRCEDSYPVKVFHRSPTGLRVEG